MKRAASILAGAACLILIGFTALGIAFRLPTDHELRVYFTAHRDTYTAIVEMLHRDTNVHRLGPDYIELLDPYFFGEPAKQSYVSNSRLDAYRRLAADVNSISIWQDTDGTVAVSKGGWGMAGHGPRWSYVWLPQPPSIERVYPTLDDFLKARRESVEYPVFVHLEDHWYISFLYEG